MNMNFTPVNKPPEGPKKWEGPSQRPGPNTVEEARTKHSQDYWDGLAERKAAENQQIQAGQTGKAGVATERAPIGGEKRAFQNAPTVGEEVAYQGVPPDLARFRQITGFASDLASVAKGGLEVGQGVENLRILRYEREILGKQIKAEARMAEREARWEARMAEREAQLEKREGRFTQQEEGQSARLSADRHIPTPHMAVPTSPPPRIPGLPPGLASSFPSPALATYMFQLAALVFMGYQVVQGTFNKAFQSWSALVYFKDLISRAANKKKDETVATLDRPFGEKRLEKAAKGLEKEEDKKEDNELEKEGEKKKQNIDPWLENFVGLENSVDTINENENKVDLGLLKGDLQKEESDLVSGVRRPPPRWPGVAIEPPAIEGDGEKGEDQDRKKTEELNLCVLRNYLTLKDGKTILENTIGRVLYPSSTGKESKHSLPVELHFALPPILETPFGEKVYLTGKETYYQASCFQEACSASIDLEVASLKNPSFLGMETLLNQKLKKEFGLEEDPLFGVRNSFSFREPRKTYVPNTAHLVTKKSRDKFLGLVEHLGLNNEFGLYTEGDNRILCRMYGTQILSSTGVWVNNFLHRKRLETVQCDDLTMLGRYRFQFLLEETKWNGESLEVLWRGSTQLDTFVPIHCLAQNNLTRNPFTKEETGITLQELTGLHLGPHYDWSF